MPPRPAQNGGQGPGPPAPAPANTTTTTIRLPRGGAWPGSMPIEVSWPNPIPQHLFDLRTLRRGGGGPRRQHGGTPAADTIAVHVPAAAVVAAAAANAGGDGVLRVNVGGGNQQQRQQGGGGGGADNEYDEDRLYRVLHAPRDNLEPRPWSHTYLPPQLVDIGTMPPGPVDVPRPPRHPRNSSNLIMITWRQWLILLLLLLVVFGFGSLAVDGLGGGGTSRAGHFAVLTPIASVRSHIGYLWEEVRVHNPPVQVPADFPDPRPTKHADRARRILAAANRTRPPLAHLAIAMRSLSTSLTQVISSPGILTYLDFDDDDDQHDDAFGTGPSPNNTTNRRRRSRISYPEYDTKSSFRATRLATGEPRPPQDAYLGRFLPRSIHTHRQKACAAVLSTWYPNYPSGFPGISHQEEGQYSDDDDDDDIHNDDDGQKFQQYQGVGFPWDAAYTAHVQPTDASRFADEFRFHAHAYKLCRGLHKLATGFTGDNTKLPLPPFPAPQQHTNGAYRGAGFRLAWSDRAPLQPGLEGLELVSRLGGLLRESGLLMLREAAEEAVRIVTVIQGSQYTYSDDHDDDEEEEKTDQQGISNGRWIIQRALGERSSSSSSSSSRNSNKIPNQNPALSRLIYTLRILGIINRKAILVSLDRLAPSLSDTLLLPEPDLDIPPSSRLSDVAEETKTNNNDSPYGSFLFSSSSSSSSSSFPYHPAPATAGQRPWSLFLDKSVLALWDMHDDAAELVRKAEVERAADGTLLALVDAWTGSARRHTSPVAIREEVNGLLGWSWADIWDWMRFRSDQRNGVGAAGHAAGRDERQQRQQPKQQQHQQQFTMLKRRRHGDGDGRTGPTQRQRQLDHEAYPAVTKWRALLPWHDAYAEEWTALRDRLGHILWSVGYAYQAAERTAVEMEEMLALLRENEAEQEGLGPDEDGWEDLDGPVVGAAVLAACDEVVEDMVGMLAGLVSGPGSLGEAARMFDVLEASGRE